MTFKNLSPGDSVEPVFSARRHNAVNSLLEQSGLNQPDLSRKNFDPWQNLTPKVKNTSGTEVPRGGVLGLDSYPFDADDDEQRFLDGEIYYTGGSPSNESHGSTKIAIALDVCPANKLRRFVVSGWARAKVNITDADHRFARLIDDDVTMLESSEAGIPMIPAQSGTGAKWASVNLGGAQPLTLYLGQPLSNVTPSTDVFTLTNLTRFPSGEAPEQIDVKNTQNLEVESGEKVVYAVEVIVDGEIEYETWGPGEGSGFPGVRFELVADFTLDAQLAVGKILNDDGTVPEEDTLIAITDEHKSFCGYGPYTDSEDEEQPGFRGTAIKYTDDQDQTRYYITSIERLYPLIIVELNDGVEEQVGPFETDFLRGIGNTYRNPKRLSSGVMNTYNTEHLADGATDATKWVAGYDANTDQYELLFGAGSVSDIEVGIIFSTIPAAVVTQSSVTPGTGNIFIESTGQVETCENLSKTPFRGDSQEPIAVGVAKRANGNWLILNDKDNRSLPGFGTINPQWMVHRGNGSFELIRACDKNVVYSVEVDTSQQTDFLVYKSRTWDGCSEAVTPIVALEDCE